MARLLRPSLAWTGAWPAARPVRQVGLQPDDVVGFLEPAAQLVIQIGAGLDHDVVPAPSRRVVDLLDDPGTVQQRCSAKLAWKPCLRRDRPANRTRATHTSRVFWAITWTSPRECSMAT